MEQENKIAKLDYYVLIFSLPLKILTATQGYITNTEIQILRRNHKVDFTLFI